MQLDLNVLLADGYRSPSQRARRMTEGWFAGQMYCPAGASKALYRVVDAAPQGRKKVAQHASAG